MHSLGLLHALNTNTGEIPPTISGHLLGERLWDPQSSPLHPHLAISLAPYKSHSGPSGPKSQKTSQKGSRGLSAPGSRKVEKKSKKGQKRVKNNLFSTFSTLFRLLSNLFDPGAERPREPFFRLFWDFGPEGPE